MIEDVIRRDERYTRFPRKPGEYGMAPLVVTPVKWRETDPDRAGECFSQQCEIAGKILARNGGRHGNETMPLAIRKHIAHAEMTFTFRRSAIAKREQLGQPPIGFTVLRIGNNLEAVLQHKPCTDKKPYPRFLRSRMNAHHTRKCIPVSNANCGKSDRLRRHDQFLGMR